MDAAISSTYCQYLPVPLSDHAEGVVIIPLASLKVSEIAEKFFPGFTQVVSSKEGFNEKCIQDLTSVKQKYETNIWWRLLKHTYTPIVGFLSGLTLGGVGYILDNVQQRGEIGIAVAAIGAAGMLLSFPLYLKQQRSENEYINIEKKLAEIEIKQAFLEALNPFTHQVAQFLELWSDFQKDPLQEKVKPLFEQLEQVQKNYAIASKKALQLVSDENYKDIYKAIAQSEDADHPLYGKIADLFLMESVCRQLKSGPIVDAWSKLKSTPFNQIVSFPSKIEPWASLGMVNPAQARDYFNFFEASEKIKNFMYANSLQYCFKKALTFYGGLKEA